MITKIYAMMSLLILLLKLATATSLFIKSAQMMSTLMLLKLAQLNY